MKLKNPGFASILLLICMTLLIQPIYAASPTPNGENFVSYNSLPPLDEPGITSQVAEIVKGHPVVQNSGTELLGVLQEGEVIVIDLSREVLPGGNFDVKPFEQLTQALNEQLELQRKYMLTFKVEGKTLNHWGMPVPVVVEEPVPDDTITIQSGPLTGKKIALNPGHGRYYTGSTWSWQRGWWWGIIEDLVNAEIQMYTAQYLKNVGATVIYLREPDKNVGIGDSGLPRWQEAARQYLQYQEAPTWVWNTSACGSNNLCKDIMARPYGANYYGADLLISLHNNGGGGTGTETWYDTTGDYHNVSSALNLAQKVQSRIINTIRSDYNGSWTDRGVQASNGGYGENHYAQMPAILIEAAFMDTQSPDNNALHDEKFKQLVAEAIVLGVCDYYNVSCPNVTDSTPPTTTASLSGTLGESNWYRSNVQVTLDAVDNSGGTGVDFIRYTINGESQPDGSDPVIFTLQDEDVYVVTFQAVDNAGNPESEQQITFGIDKSAPTGSLVINHDASVTHATLVYLHSTTADATSGVSRMRFRDAGGTWIGWLSYDPKHLWQLPGPTGQAFSVEVQFKDRAGNESGIYTDAIPLDIYPDWPASANYRLAKTTLGVSGGPGSSAGYQLRGTLGQPSAVSIMAGTAHTSSWGYWAILSSAPPEEKVYLPVIVK